MILDAGCPASVFELSASVVLHLQSTSLFGSSQELHTFVLWICEQTEHQELQDHSVVASNAQENKTLIGSRRYSFEKKPAKTVTQRRIFR